MLPPPGNPRILIGATLVNTLGNGAWLTVSTLYLTRSVGLSATEVALSMSVAAVVGIGLSTPLGYFTDRQGAKIVQIGALLTLAGCYALLTLVHDFAGFTTLACVIAVGDTAVRGANGTMVAAAVPPEGRVRLRAFLRSTNNLGIGVGTLVGGLALLWESSSGYTMLLWGNAVSFLLAAALVGRATPVARAHRPADQPRLVALRDRPFMTFALVDGLMASTYNAILSLALPLWLVARTDAPLWLVSAALIVNTAGCVTLQVWAAKGADTAVAAKPLGRRGALVVGASCVLFGLIAGLPSWAVGVMVLVAAVVHVLGEIWLSTATWSVVYGLAPDWAQGQYQGTYFTGRQIGNMVAPLLLTTLAIGGGVPGWIALGGLFAAAGLVYPAIVQWGLRTRAPLSYA